MQEHERKFLPRGELDLTDHKTTFESIRQKYIMMDGKKLLRARKSQKGLRVDCYLTFKEKISESTCVEIEKLITEDEYYALTSEFPELWKHRYTIHFYGEILWTLDVFKSGPKKGECLIEGEALNHKLTDINNIALPEFCGEEVTDNPEWKNINMVIHDGNS